MAISSIISTVKISFSIILYIWGFGQSMSDHLSPVGSIDFIISHGNGRCSSSKSGTTAVLCINKCIGATTQALQVDESHDLQPETIFSARSQIHSSICVSHILSTVLQAVWTFPVSQDSSLRNAATWQGVAWDWASTPQWSHLLGKYPTTSAPLRFTQWRNRPWTYMDFLEMIIYSSTWQRQIPHPQCFYRKDEWALELICGITQYPVRDCQGSIDFSNTSAPAPGELGQLRRPHIVEFQVSQILRLIAWLPWTGTPALLGGNVCSSTRSDERLMMMGGQREEFGIHEQVDKWHSKRTAPPPALAQPTCIPAQILWEPVPWVPMLVGVYWTYQYIATMLHS